MTRLVFAITVVGLTAFAPAPFPRRVRTVPRHSLDLNRLSAHWKVVSMWQYGPNATIGNRITVWKEIHIEKGQWKFCRQTNGVITPSTTYNLVIDAARKPATIDFKRPGQAKVWMMGIVRIKGEQLEVLYKPFATERPTSFENPPSGFYLFTLRRGK